MTEYNVTLIVNNIWQVFRVVLDIGFMWLAIYMVMVAARNNSRTIQIFKGIILVIFINSVAKLFGFTTITYFTDLFLNWGLLAIIIIFQPEIRAILEKIGTTNNNMFSKIGTLLSNEKENLVEQLYQATITLSQSRTGALISIEQSQSMQDYIKTGIAVNAEVTKELLCSIFMTTTPLHDGAIIIQGDKVACASAYFPPTSVNLSSRYGARHRAALGIAEVTDALTIVVSEETSAISIAEKGRIFSVDEQQLKEYLRRVICNDVTTIEKTTRKRSSLLSDDESVEIEVEEDKETERKGFFNFGRKNEEASSEENDMKVPVNNRLKKKNSYKPSTPKKEEETESEADFIAIEDNLNQEADDGKR
ncbi:MAG: diadenylate cyclase CdaA [Erysipelotrichaceae bacterium]|nr:diadenylate cyclase CdaA [Erysipelotrichaceae bacterium]